MTQVTSGVCASCAASQADKYCANCGEKRVTITTQTKTWIVVMIPMFALALAVLYGFRRYFFEHLIFATHIYAFVLAWLVAGGITLSVTFRTIGGAARQYSNAVISVVILAGLPVYLYLALRRVYSDGRVAAAIRALVLAVLWIPLLNVYCLLLFFITLRMMH